MLLINKTTMFKFTGQLLEVAPIKEFQGSKYSSIVIRSEDIADGQMVKYKLDLNKVDHSILSEVLDSEVTVMVKIVKGANSTASLKVVEVMA